MSLAMAARSRTKLFASLGIAGVSASAAYRWMCTSAAAGSAGSSAPGIQEILTQHQVTVFSTTYCSYVSCIHPCKGFQLNIFILHQILRSSQEPAARAWDQAFCHRVEHSRARCGFEKCFDQCHEPTNCAQHFYWHTSCGWL